MSTDEGPYSNDDYSDYAGPDYQNRRRRHPGVSGKSREDGNWTNRDVYDVQRDFAGKGPKGYRRSDDRIYEEVCDVLLRSPDIDASHIGVRVEAGVVHLSGEVVGRPMKRLAEYLIEDLPGVEDVRNELTVQRD